ncbi:MAG: endonuclease/exonuclease/phosphatase family protein, partial [Paracoccaceae bacterium]
MATKNPDPLIGTRLRVLTWNLWWQYGPWQERAPAIEATLANIDADVIALQEVWGDGQTDYAAILAQKLGYHHVHARAMDIGGVFQGNAILSRWPIEDSEIIKLYGAKGIDENRVAIFAGIDGPRGRLPVFCTHLNWKQQHSQIRQRQIVDLANFVQRRKGDGYPPIVCGDFNANPHSDEIRMMTGQTACPVNNLVFHDAWDFAGPGGPGYTWDNVNPYVAKVLEPDRRIDYIFTGWAGAPGTGHIRNC